MNKEALTEQIIGYAIDVHRVLGSGLLGCAYEECLCYELKEHGLSFARQAPLPIVYKDVQLECGYLIYSLFSLVFLCVALPLCLCASSVAGGSFL